MRRTAVPSNAATVRAPDFPPGLDWVNTSRPLALAELRGRLVLLDFWTFGCINCLHVIPDLLRLEQEFGDALVVIGVHASKFSNEARIESLRRVVQRYGITHPVVADPDYAIWQAYAVRAWPTTVLIDPTGRIIAQRSGEGVYDAIHDLVAETIATHQQRGTLHSGPLTLMPEEFPETALRFPGKVLADATHDRLYIADSGHNRIIVATLAGQVLALIGSGEPSLRDGAWHEAALNQPQGMALDGEHLYLADAGNHAVRVAHLAKQTLQTVAGDGSLAYGQPAGHAAETRLNSPWDLVRVGRMLFIAMAGTHQLWALNLDTRQIGPFAGSGREGLHDGPRPLALMAQPSGLTTDGERLYVADAEASAIRAIGWEPDDRVHTVIGQGLFVFGDVDGGWSDARLQHPLGVAHHQGLLYVADTYNHKLKVIDVGAGQVSTLLGDGEPGWVDGEAPRFSEPGGLCGAAGLLYVADTNNHVVRIVDLATRSVSTLALADPEGLLTLAVPGAALPILQTPPQEVRPGSGRIRLRLRLPAGYKVNAQAASRLVWQPEVTDPVHIAEGERDISLQGRAFPVDTPARFTAGTGTLRGELTLYYCADEAAVCLIHRVALAVPLTVRADSEHADISVPVMVPPPVL